MMASDSDQKLFVINGERLPVLFPTHRHAPEFWEHLGRTIATYSFLEYILGRAIFALTATREYGEEEWNAAHEKWQNTLNHALSDTLYPLVDTFVKSAKENQRCAFEGIDDLGVSIKNVVNIRNVLCHGSWNDPNGFGASLPFFFNKKSEKFEDPIDVSYLRHVQEHVVELIVNVMNVVTSTGWQFPGFPGTGKVIWPD